MNWMFRFLAYFFSIVFHPLLMLTYMLTILLIVNPYLFGPTITQRSDVLVLVVFLSTFLIPAFAVFLMSALGLISSIELKDRQERIGPYIITGVFYLWVFRNLLDNPDMPLAFKIFTLGATIGLFLAFFVNLFSKVSMHATGMGVLLGMVVITMLKFSYENFTLQLGGNTFQMSIHTILLLVIILCGIVGTARLFLGAHDPKDLYGGFVIGFGTQFLALTILGG